MRFQGENTVDLQNPPRPTQQQQLQQQQQQQHQQPHQPLSRAPAVAPPGASNGVLLNAVQKDLESKYLNVPKSVQWLPDFRREANFGHNLFDRLAALNAGLRSS